MQNNRETIAFIWDFSVEPVDVHTWEDGLKMALLALGGKYDYDVIVIVDDDTSHIYDRLRDIQPDIILAWGSLDRPSFAGVREFADVTALCFAGGPTVHPHSDNFDVIFVENDSYYEDFKKQGKNVVKAFGTNDELFRPLDTYTHFRTFYPAAFAKWKRHELFWPAAGKTGIACGKILSNPIDFPVYQEGLRSGSIVLPQLPYRALVYLYNQAYCTLITASSIGGSQRAVLESMACNIPPIVMSDNEKTSEYVLDSGFGYIVEPNVDAIKDAVERSRIERKTREPKGRKYIEENYSAEKYADTIHAGLQSVNSM